MPGIKPVQNWSINTFNFTDEQHACAMLCACPYAYNHDAHVCISAHVLAYAAPASFEFTVRVLRAVEIANGLTPVKKIRTSRRMSDKLGLYYHRSEIALQPFGTGDTRRPIPSIALHELGHHWHFSEGKDWRADRTRDWKRIVGANDIANNYEARYKLNHDERIAECFALFMIDPSCLSDDKRYYFETQGLQSHSAWAIELDKLKAAQVPLENLTNSASASFKRSM